jgi:eukaryotic-like serine/threonine-protein kinase
MGRSDPSPHSSSSGTMPELAPGDSVAHYRIENKLGAGGMGVVYRATDTRLGRSVALKFVNSSFGDRGLREARAVAALNHPNICTLHDVGPNYLVMELVEGPTLLDRIKQGPIPLDEALAIARQIADALDASHQKGIVHRDLKPANIKICEDGKVKVLDFGLAKSLRDAPSGDPEESPTVTLEATRPGVILGTAAYMSPEQARGKAVDKRADIWAFGVVLYEMLTGQHLFTGETAGETLAGVLKQEPDLSATPPKVRTLLRSCLEKQPDRRLRDIADACLLLSDSAVADATRGKGSGVLWPVMAGGAILALAAVSWLHFREVATVSVPLRFQILPPEGHAAGSLLNVSPDGQKVAFLAGGRLWVHFLESGESRDLTAASGTAFWSPDSRFIAYAGREGLLRVEATGGVPRIITPLKGSWGGGTWNQHDVIVFSIRTAIFRVPAAGGVPVPLIADGETDFPHFLPDGIHFLYTRRAPDGRKSAVRIGSITARPEAQTTAALVNSPWGAFYARSTDPGNGHLLFIRDSTLMAQPMNPRELVLTGPAVPVADHIDDGRAYSVSGNGVLVFQQQSLKRQLTWADRQGKSSGTIGDPEFFGGANISPDGTRAILWIRPFDQAANLWLMDLRSGLRTRIGLSSANEFSAVWTPTGDRVIFASDRSGGRLDLYQQAVNGAGPEPLFRSDEDKLPTSCSPDGRLLLYSSRSRTSGSDIWLLPLEGPYRPISFLQSDADESDARISPDGHLVAYISNESGRPEVYIRSFATKPGAVGVELGEKHLISDSGVVGPPRWRTDGRELYYVRPAGGMLMAVDIAAQSEFRAGPPRPLFHSVEPDTVPVWDVTPDGKRFLVAMEGNTTPGPYTVILNWQATLKR